MAYVLVVDDEVPIVAVLAELVEDCGHIALTAFNGADVLAVALATPPALIISDVMMPVMDGYALLKAIREDDGLVNIAVYLMSAAAFRPSQSGEALADGYMPKPFSLAAIEGLLAGIR